MKNNFKKLAAVVLALVMCVSTLVPVFAAEVCPGVGKVHTATNCTWTEAGTKAADCDNAGTVSGKCDACSAVFTVSTTPALGHNWETISGDCTTSATKKCANCGETKVVAGAEGHDWSAWKVAGGECKIGVAASRTCAVCKFEEKVIMAEEHNWELVSVTEPVDCQTPGVATYKCGSEGCGETQTAEVWNDVEQYHLWKDLVDADNDGKADLTATKVGVIADKDRRLVSQNITATCFRAGKQAKICDTCGKTTVDDVKQEAHNFVANPEGGIGAVITKPTCTKAGLKGYAECTYCHQYKYNKSAWTFAKDAAEGVGAYASTKDEEIVITANKADLAIPAQHDWKLSGTQTPATCTTVGQEVVVCEGDDDCIYKTDAKKELIPATGHKYYCDLTTDEEKELYKNDKKLTEVKTPTCQTEAYEQYGCLNNCGLTGVEKKIVKAAKVECVANTQFDLALSTANTCSTPGQLVYKCKWCNNILPAATVVVEATGHELVISTDFTVTGAKEPTCKEEGIGYYVCKHATDSTKNCIGGDLACDYVPQKAEHQLVTLPKVDHKWQDLDGDDITLMNCGNWDKDKATYVRVCKWCATTQTFTETQPAHDYYEFNKDTYTDPNKIEVFQKGDSATNCTTTFVYAPKCKECGKSSPTKVIDSTTFGKGHVKEVTAAAVAATCDKDGKTEAWKCTAELFGVKCTYVEEAKTVKALHINEKTGVAYAWSDVQALLAKNGLKVCPVCPTPTKADGTDVVVVKIDDKSEHPAHVTELKVTDTLTWVFYVPETCTENDVWGGFKCSICGTKDYTNNAYDLTYTKADTATLPKHKFTMGTPVLMTCEQYGYTPAECTVCEGLFQLNYVTAEHSFPEDAQGNPVYENVVLPNCELDGSYTQTCETCGLVHTTIVEALGHHNEAGLEIVDSCLDRTVDRKCYVCKLVIPMSHRFGEWTVNGEVETRTCVDCGTVEEKAVQAPETEAPVTDAPVTEAPVTEAPETEAPVTEAPETEAPADEKGCGSSIAAIGVALVATLGTCAVFCGKKKED